MKLSDFIKTHIFSPRLKQNGILVVYDPDKRYYDICMGIANETIQVIDASKSSIISREEAMKTLNELGRQGTKLEGMIVYVPAKAPVSDEEKQHDPFALYTVCGQVFPDGDGDEFMNICLKAKPDFAAEIRSVFKENPNPNFSVIDAIGVGIGWPNLRSLLKVESSQDILFALLAPSDKQSESLKTEDSWVSEAKELFFSCFGLKLI